MNIYIEKSRLTQFGSLMKFEDHNIFSSYDIQIINGEIQTNIDLFIVGTHDTYNKLAEFGSPILNKVIWFKQYKKSSLIAQLNSFIEDENFVKLDVAQIPESYDWSQYSFKPKKYFVKYEYGARSLNTFIVDNTKISLATFLSKLRKAKGVNKDEYKSIIQELSSSNGVEYIKGNTKHDGEEFEHSKLEFYPHEELPNIENEYRIVFSNYGANAFVFQRQRNEKNNGVVDNELNYVGRCDINGHLFPVIMKCLNEAIKKLDIFHGSIDLLIKRNGEWSIAEMSNQYGAGDIPEKYKNTILEECITSCIDSIK